MTAKNYEEIKLFCSVTASYSHLPELLSSFRLKHPYIEFKLLTGDPAQAIDKILHDEADIAISAMPEQLPSRIEFATISEIPLSVIAPLGISSFMDELQKSSLIGMKFRLLSQSREPRAIEPIPGLSK